jgi:hypothetical protein
MYSCFVTTFCCFMALFTTASLVKLGALGVVASVASLPGLLLVAIVMNVLVLNAVLLFPLLPRALTFVKRVQAPGVPQNSFQQTTTSLVVHGGLRQRSLAFPVALALQWAARVSLAVMSPLMALLAAVDDPEVTAGSDAGDVEFIPGKFLGEVSIVDFIPFPLLALSCAGFIILDIISDFLPILQWVFEQLQKICVMWEIASCPDHSSLMLFAYEISIVKSTPVSQPNKNEAQTDQHNEEDDVDTADNDSETENGDEADVTLVNGNQSPVTHSKSNFCLSSPQPAPILASRTSHSALRTSASSLIQLHPSPSLPSLTSIATQVDANIVETGSEVGPTVDDHDFQINLPPSSSSSVAVLESAPILAGKFQVGFLRIGALPFPSHQ